MEQESSATSRAACSTRCRSHWGRRFPLLSWAVELRKNPPFRVRSSDDFDSRIDRGPEKENFRIPAAETEQAADRARKAREAKQAQGSKPKRRSGPSF